MEKFYDCKRNISCSKISPLGCDNLIKAVITAFVLAASFCFSFEASAYSAVDFYRAAKKYGCPNPFAATVQCAHETGDWTSYLWVKARNGAGMKADKEWKAAGKPCINRSSAEHINGKNVSVVSSFRKYKSTKAFIKDYSRKIREDYPHSAKQKGNVWGYFAGLYKGRTGKWATDKAYFNKLTAKAVKLAPQIYGSAWKKKLKAQFVKAKKAKLLEPWQESAVRSALGV